MGNISRLELLVNMGFDHNPFEGCDTETADRMRIRKTVALAVKSHALVSIVGERGSGKTWSAVAALEKLDAELVLIDFADYRRLLITDIEQEMIMTLSDERPMRGKSIRKRQLRRVLGEATRRKQVVVVIEEAHALHGNTIRALKTLRRLDWMGKKDLFTVVLLGQSDPLQNVSEIRLRGDCVRMQGLSAKEAQQYVRNTVGSVFEDAAVDALAGRGIRNYLDLQDAAIRVMGQAWAEGRDKVKKEDVDAVFGAAKAVDNVTKAVPVAADGGNDVLRDVINKRQTETALGMRAAI
ncbi:AAA ATPase [uncultured Desulfobacterium sp.]|uniref:AAA ATPase n=1 Tax=uncultured Desulfobacterium sp. TaxID=201089 RepID=A0A445MWN6_9BACT|nr:AAA ATPase [uncultured Desulfobacterium sp.]